LALLSDEIRARISEIFEENLVDPVRLVYFTIPSSGLFLPGVRGCETCNEVQGLLEEVADISDKVTLEVHHLEREREVAQQYGVNSVPTTLIMGADDRRVRFLGAPAGNEFGTFLQDIQMVSRGETMLSEETRATLSEVADPIHLQVFVTPT
jgi:alkyl hydroperoxide reductase subunit AhpF